MKSIYCLILIALVSCNKGSEESSSATRGDDGINEQNTKEVLDHHWAAFKANDLDETMEDYTEESMLITPEATYRGIEEIRNNFISAFKTFPKDSSTFSLDKSVALKDVGYILWKSKTPTINVSYATDTFIIRHGKIVRQTFAGVIE